MTRLMEIQNITFTPGDKAKQTVVSAVLAPASVLVLRGPSGAGKTTLLRILARLREAENGLVLLQGAVWTGFLPHAWRCKVHYAAQKPVVFDGSVLDNLARPFELAAVKNELSFNRDMALALMEKLLLPAVMLDQDARTLSGGEASRVALVRAILVEPQVLMLDEPLAALDAEAAGAVLRLMADWVTALPGRGIILVSHVGEVAGLPGLTILELPGKEGETIA